VSAHNDAAFLRMFLIVLGALVAFTVIIIIAANRITGAADEVRGEDPRERALVAGRIQPVGQVNVAGQPAAARPAAPAAPKAAGPAEPTAAPAAAAEVLEQAAEAVQDAGAAIAEAAESAAAAVAGAVAQAPAGEPDLEKGKAIYATACFACHMTGAAGAPKLDDKAAWAPRIAQGMEAMVANSINGKGAMPPKGGRADLSDEDVRAAVAYMVEELR
jgi:cytochrome c5